MSRVLIIGAGGVGGVVTHKCAQASTVFTDICLASRTLEKPLKIAAQLKCPIRTAKVNADNPAETVALIRDFKPDVVHGHWTYEFALGAMDTGLPCGVTAHDSPYTIVKYFPNLAV